MSLDPLKTAKHPHPSSSQEDNKTPVHPPEEQQHLRFKKVDTGDQILNILKISGIVLTFFISIPVYLLSKTARKEIDIWFEEVRTGHRRVYIANPEMGNIAEIKDFALQVFKTTGSPIQTSSTPTKEANQKQKSEDLKQKTIEQTLKKQEAIRSLTDRIDHSSSPLLSRRLHIQLEKKVKKLTEAINGQMRGVFSENQRIEANKCLESAKKYLTSAGKFTDNTSFSPKGLRNDIPVTAKQKNSHNVYRSI